MTWLTLNHPVFASAVGCLPHCQTALPNWLSLIPSLERNRNREREGIFLSTGHPQMPAVATAGSGRLNPGVHAGGRNAVF